MSLFDSDNPETTEDEIHPVDSMVVQPRRDGDFYVSVGDVIAGKYRVERVLGVGGMAFVLSAKHVELEEHFALKFLNEQFLRQAAVIERFTREAKAACKIRNEHVARVYDVGTYKGAPFLVMEHLDGRDLATIVVESGALRIEDAVEYTMQACEALAAAHSHGIVHRDIKPENLFLLEHEGLPIIKLLDFGISKIALTGGNPGSRLTGQLTLGTPCYMSPEQIRSTASADARSDLWSLGVVLYELLAGTEAFRADTVTEVCAAVLEQEPRPLRELRPDIPQELAEVVARCMQKDAADRFANVAELAAALLPFAPTRALVSAERSSSLIRAARRAHSGEQLISAVRPSSSTPSARHRSGEASASGAPLSRSIGPSVDADEHPAAADETPPRRWASIALATAAFSIVIVLGVLAHQTRGQSDHDRTAKAGAPATTPLEGQPLAAAPVVTRTAHALDEASPAERAVTTPGIQKRALSPDATPPPRLGAPHASAAVRPSSFADAGVVGARATPAVSASAAVELGY